MINILIADDHRLVIDGLLLMLREEQDMHCVGEASNGREVLALLETTQAEVLLLDINMPEMDGLDCCKQVIDQYPAVKVLVFVEIYFCLTKTLHKNKCIDIRKADVTTR